MKKCDLCGIRHEPKNRKKIAYWAISWCEFASGDLCDECQKAAAKLKSAFGKKYHPAMCEIAWGSDVLKESRSVNALKIQDAARKEMKKEIKQRMKALRSEIEHLTLKQTFDFIFTH